MDPLRTDYDLFWYLESDHDAQSIINNKLNLEDVHQLLNDQSTTFDGIDGKFSFTNNVISRKLKVLEISNGKANLVK